jgi:plasmid stabilization system protein ParE
MNEIVWTELAKSSLQETIDFLRTHWDEKTINELIDLIDKRTEQLFSNPNIGPKVTN